MFARYRARKEAKRQQEEAKRQDVIAGFEKRLEDISALPDMGEQYEALEAFAHDAKYFWPESCLKQKRSRETQKKIAVGSGPVAGVAVALGMGMSDMLAPGTSLIMASIAGACSGVFPGLFSALAIENRRISKKLIKQERGLLDALTALREQAKAMQTEILTCKTALLAKSKISNEIFCKYPAVREHFAKVTFAESKKTTATPRPGGLQL